MKIRDYIGQTTKYCSEYETVANTAKTAEDYIPLITRLLNLYDAIELRESDVAMWKSHGLSDDDDIPELPKRIIWPDFGNRQLDVQEKT